MTERATRLGTVIGGSALLMGTAAVALLFARPDQEGPVAFPWTSARPLAQPATQTADARNEAKACQGREGPTVTPARPVGSPAGWFSSDDYPWTALAANHTGRVQTNLVIGSDGRIIACGIAGSSGHWSLDARACTVLRSRARFVPARDAAGCPVVSQWPLGIRWAIPAT